MSHILIIIDGFTVELDHDGQGQGGNRASTPSNPFNQKDLPSEVVFRENRPEYMEKALKMLEKYMKKE